MFFIVRVHIAAVAAIIVLTAGVASPQSDDCGDETVICAAGSPWNLANEAKLRVSTEASADFVQWQFKMPEANSLSIQFESKSEGQRETGRIILVAGRVMLTNGFSPPKGYEIDALDLPVLNYRLAITLLSQAFPPGPDKFNAKQAIDLAEKKRSIRVATVSAGGSLPAPWKLKGEMRRRDVETIEFSFRFACEGKEASPPMLLEGEWTKRTKSPQFDPGMSLEGWSLYTLGGVSIKQEGGTILDYAAQAQPTKLKTLGELQESLRKQDAKPKDQR